MSDSLLSDNITIQIIIIITIVWIITLELRINKTVTTVETFVCIQKLNVI